MYYREIDVNNDEEALQYSDVTSVRYLYINNVSNLNWLSNLESIDYRFLLSNNNLTNLDGLENLRIIGGSGDVQMRYSNLTHFDLPSIENVSWAYRNPDDFSGLFSPNANRQSVITFANRIISGRTGAEILEEMEWAHLLDNTDDIINAANEVF